MDLVARIKSFPRPGETVLSDDFAAYPGGKGANQAVCCAKLGGKVEFIAKMGSDVYREKLLESLKRDKVNTDLVLVDRSSSTGVALILVDENGQNEIAVVSGSNMRLRPEDLTNFSGVFKKARVVLSQLEIPLETVAAALRLAGETGALTILNPAPARILPDSIYRFVDVLTPNETECEMLSGVKIVDDESLGKAAAKLLEKGVRNVIVTVGDKGAILVNDSGASSYGSTIVETVDTTGAGDAFNGALAYSLSIGDSMDKAISFANSVAAFSVTRKGAQASMPTRKELEDFLKVEED